MAGTIIGLTANAQGQPVLPSSAKSDLSTDIATPSSAVRQALDAAGLGQGATSDADVAALVQNTSSATGAALESKIDSKTSALSTAVASSVKSSGVARIVPVADGDPLPTLADGDLVVRYFAPGALYFTDFAAATVGAAPAGFTPQWKTFDGGWSVKADAAATGGKVLSLTSNTAERFGLAWDTVGADAERGNVEVLFRSKIAGTAAGSLPTAVARASGAVLSETGYRGGGRAMANRTVSKYVGGAYTDLLSDAFTMTAQTWYMTRFRVNGSTIQVKVWADGATEPGAWLTATDSSITAPGWVGLALTSNAGERHIDWIAAGTGGRKAVKP